MSGIVVSVEDVATSDVQTSIFHTSPVSIGRAPSSAVRVQLPFVAERHGEIEFDEDHVWYRAIDPEASAILNGRSAPVGGRVDLTESSELWLGGQLRLQVRRCARAMERVAVDPILRAHEGAGAAASPPDKLERGATLGRYEIRQHLGAGGMGTVYRAFDPRTKRNVAIKTIPRSMWRMKEAFKRFEREAQAVAQLDHPSIVKVLDFGVESGRPYIVMELLVGEDLATTLGRGPLEAAPAVDVALSVCAGVSACHKLGIVHRDIKPRNIFIHRAMFGEVVKVLDFGVSRLPQAAQLTGPADIIGTAGYMSPEQADGRGAGPPSDQYAIGVVLYEMLTGARPFSGKDYEEIRRQILAGRVERPSRRISTIPVELEEVVLPALSREPEARFGSVHEMGAVLLPFASERGKRQWTDFFSAPLAELPQDFSGPTVRRPALSGTPTSSGAPPDRGEDRAAALAAPTIVPAETGAPSPLGAPESRARAIVATAASPEAPVGGGGRSGRRHAVLAAAAASLLGGGLWIWSRGRLEGAQLTRDVPSAQGTGKAPLGPPGAARAGGPSSETSGQSTIDGGPPASGLPNLGAGL